MNPSHQTSASLTAERMQTAGLVPQQSLHLTLNSELPNLDLSRWNSFLCATLFANLNEGLVRLDKAGHPVPGLADSWQVSVDGLTYTFHLRESFWANGDPVTADDFLYSWLRTLNPATEAQYAVMLHLIRGGQAYNSGEADESAVAIQTPDERTLIVQLEAPTPFFLGLMAFPIFFPQHSRFVEAAGDLLGTEAKHILCNGPFRMESWEHGHLIRLVRNERYWDREAVALDEVCFHVIKDGALAVARYEADELDVIALTGEHALRFEGTPDYRSVPELCTGYLQFNQSVPALQNAKVRRALSFAVNRRAMASHVYGTGAIEATGFVPEGVSNSLGGEFRQIVGDLIENSWNRTHARDLLQEGLAEMGLTDFPSLLLLVSDDDIGQSSADFVCREWREVLGLDITPEPVAYKNRLRRTHVEHDFDIALSHWGADYNDPMAFLEILTTGHEFNNPQWSHPDYDILIEQARHAADPTQRMEHLYQAERLLLHEMPISPLYFTCMAILAKPHLQNFRWEVYGPFYDLKHTSIALR